MCKTKKELQGLVEKYRDLTAKKKKIDTQLDEVKDEIIDYVVRKGDKGGKNGMTLIVIGDGFKVSYITTVSHPLDSDKVKEFLGDRLPDFQTEKSSNKLDIR